MCTRLAGFVGKQRHCNVPTNNAQDPQLGRWVAAQRHRRRLGVLTEEQIEQLDSLGFVWSPADLTWETLFLALKEFKHKFGHCDVPTKWRKNPALADWVQRQRLCKKRGGLSAERLQRLEKLKFSWAIYRGGKLRKAPAQPVQGPEEQPEGEGRERLYRIRSGTYVQYGRKGKKPDALEQYLKQHNGELPPFIPLPPQPAQFILGEGWSKQRKVRWKGQGKLPPEVLAYVGEHGTLPPYD